MILRVVHSFFRCDNDGVVMFLTKSPYLEKHTEIFMNDIICLGLANNLEGGRG